MSTFAAAATLGLALVGGEPGAPVPTPEVPKSESGAPEPALPAPASWLDDWSADAHGYLLTRAQVYATDRTRLLYPILEIEPLRVMHEVQAEGYLKGPGFYAYADLAALARIVPRGCSGEDEHLGCLVLNEAYAEWLPIDALRLLAGRHRAQWGRALTVQYVEALNATPDVVDPLSQRLGVWMALAELSLGGVIVSAIVAPEVEHDELGLPKELRPLYGHAALRAGYAGDGYDASAVGYWDYGAGTFMGGALGSAVLWERLVLHGQALVHDRRRLDTGKLEEGSCPGIADIGIPFRPQLDVSANAGAYYNFDDGSLAGAEWVHQGDGVQRDDFVTTLNTVVLIKQMCPNARISPPSIARTGRPPPLSNTLLARDYVAITGLRPSLAEWSFLEDTSGTATLLLGIDDLSALASARIAHTIAQTATLRLAVLVPLGLWQNQFTILPFDASVIGEIQVSF